MATSTTCRHRYISWPPTDVNQLQANIPQRGDDTTRGTHNWEVAFEFFALITIADNSLCANRTNSTAPKAQQPKPVSIKVNVGANTRWNRAEMIKTFSTKVSSSLQYTHTCAPRNTTPNAKTWRMWNVGARFLLTPKCGFYRSQMDMPTWFLPAVETSATQPLMGWNFSNNLVHFLFQIPR